MEGLGSEFVQADEEERGETLANLMKQELSAALKPGVGRFESLLTPIGLGGAIVDSVRRALLELSEVRSLLVHRAGIVDARLVSRCPWLGARKGDRLHVTRPEYHRFLLAGYWYVAELEARAHLAEYDVKALESYDRWKQLRGLQGQFDAMLESHQIR